MDGNISKIIQGPLFLKLKAVIENNDYHNHEDVYSHLLKTMGIAKKEIRGGFITNPEAKEMFAKFAEEELHGVKRKDTMILTALLHDIGKILQYKEDSKNYPILVTDSQGITSCPGHEYWGSAFVRKLLGDLQLPPEILKYIENVIRLHDTFGADFFEHRRIWSIEVLINDVKSRAEDFYKEALFNIYCDCFTAAPFLFAKEKIIKIFNDPSLYEKREYFIL